MPDPQPDGVTLPTLVMTGGPLDGTSYPLAMSAKSVVLGSSMDADVQIMLGNVEPHHAQLTFGAAGLSIADAGSATGTFVNGERVEGEQTLQEGDRLCLGPPGAKDSAKLVVKLPGGGAVATPSTTPAVGAPEAPPEASPLFIDDGERPLLALEDDTPGPDLSPAPPPPPPPAPPAPPPPAPEPEASLLDPTGEILLGEAILAAEEVVMDDGAAGPPLEATDAPAEADALFDEPLPPVPSPPAEAPAPGVPPPPSPTPPPLTAPPPEPEAPAPPPPEAPAESPRAAAPSPAVPRGRSTARKRRAGRKRGFSLPVVPMAGGLVAAIAIGAGVWWFFLRATLPVLTAVTPASVEPGQAVTLTGESFASQPEGNTVLFGPQQAAVTAATDTSLEVVVPDELGDTPSVPVVVKTPSGRSRPVSVSVLRNPRITALEPDVALPGQSVVIRGERLSGQITVTIGGTSAEVTETTEELVRAVVPNLALREGDAAAVVVKAGAVTAKPADLLIGRLPLLLELTPSRGAIGERVAIKGRGFAPEPDDNAVTFGGAPALVLSAAPDELVVVAPATRTAASPESAVVVTAGGKASSGNTRFTTTRATTSGFRPRFFAAPTPEFPGEPLAFVSTELAPVLLLGAPGQAASTAARAAEAASRLNALVDGASSRPIELEFRDNPPSVGVAGEVDSVLVATPEDAAAYARPWQSGARSGPKVNTRALARHWAAILQDYFGLFLYRQRPLGVLSLSRHGQVFKSIYGEAVRRASGGNGVPTSVVYPTSEAMARNLRLAALVPSPGTPREAVAVEGRWRGTLEDPDTGSYRFETRFELEGKGLKGSFTAGRGKIEARSPLREISFRQGTLRFTVDLRGTALEFEGILDDTTISGAARQPGRSSAPFTLQYME